MENLIHIAKKIKEYDRIVLFRHIRPDFDALGSQIGLMKLIQATYPEKEVYSVGKEEKSLSFLNAPLDEVEDQVFEGALCIVLDTATTDRIDDERFSLGKELIMIDHHPNENPYGDLSWVDTSYSSASEMITHLYQLLKKHARDYRFTMTKEAAQFLFTGIVGDTGRFLFNNTKSRTHEMTSLLMTFDVNPKELYDRMYNRSEGIARFHGHVLTHFQKTANGVAYFAVTEKDIASFQISTSEAANLVNVLSGIEGIPVWVFFVEDGEGYRLRLRSKNITINTFAQRYGGGGHELACGVNLASHSDMPLFLEALDQFVAESSK